MTIYIGHFGANKYKKLSDCAKASFGCATPESMNQIPTMQGTGQSQITLNEILSNIGVDASTLALDDIITTNIIPTKSFLQGVAVDLACKLDGWEFEFVTVKQNGVTSAGDVNFDVAALAAGALNTTTYATASGVTTATVTDSAAALAAFGTAGTNITYAPASNSNYFGSYGAIGIKVKSKPAATAACRDNSDFGKCAVFTATWLNLQPCIRKCSDSTCTQKGSDVVVLA